MAVSRVDVRLATEAGFVLLDEFGVLWLRGVDVPSGAGDQAFRCRAREFEELAGDRRLGADELHRGRNAELACLTQDAGGFLGKAAEHDQIGIGGLDLGELRRKLHVAALKGLGGDDLDAERFKRLLLHVIGGLGELIVDPVDLRHALDFEAIDDGLEHARRDAILGRTDAENEIADIGNAAGGVRCRNHRDPGLLRKRIGSERARGERRPDDGDDLVAADEALKDVDGLAAIGAVVEMDQLQLLVAEHFGRIGLVDDQLGRILRLDAI